MKKLFFVLAVLGIFSAFSVTFINFINADSDVTERRPGKGGDDEEFDDNYDNWEWFSLRHSRRSR